MNKTCRLISCIQYFYLNFAKILKRIQYSCRRGHGWVRDGFLSNDKFCEKDFMFHGWKANQTGLKGWQSSFTVGFFCLCSMIVFIVTTNNSNNIAMEKNLLALSSLPFFSLYIKSRHWASSHGVVQRKMTHTG